MGTKETMTIHKALSELKVIDSRIEKLIDNATYVTCNKHNNSTICGKTVDETKENIKSEYQKITDLISRRNALKRAVVLSNASTIVKINGVEYTVAEAIEMKNHGIENKQLLVSYMDSQNNSIITKITKNNESLNEKAEAHIVALYGSRDTKVDTKAMEDTKKNFIEANTLDLIDPIKVSDEINKMQKEIDAFISEVDSTLSVSNAVTEITFEY